MAKKVMDEETPVDPTGFLISGSFAEFVLMNTNEIVSRTLIFRSERLKEELLSIELTLLNMTPESAPSNSLLSSDATEIHVHAWLYFPSW